jgi:hypothetical protein
MVISMYIREEYVMAVSFSFALLASSY